jgi:hypothetical protein
MMTTVTAAQTRAILANAHATYHAGHPDINATSKLVQALKQTNMINATDSVWDIQNDGTTLLIILQSREMLELDAYGNILRGQA